jgi:hypothetical protein
MRIAFALAVAFTTLACTAPSAPLEPAAPDDPVTRGGTFQFGARGGANHLNWYSVGAGSQGPITLGPVYEPLVSFDYQPSEPSWR